MQSEIPSNTTQLAAQARGLIRGARTAVLSSLLADGGAPYGSLVLSATGPDAAPILLLSKLAVHIPGTCCRIPVPHCCMTPQALWMTR